MGRRLVTPAEHRILASPFGAFLDNPAFEALVIQLLGNEFAIARVAAAASMASSSGADDFSGALGAEVPGMLWPYAASAIAMHGFDMRAYEAAAKRWDEAFWSGDRGATTGEELVVLDEERRNQGTRYARPTLYNLRPLGPLDLLGSVPFMPPVKFNVPGPDEVMARWASELANPDLLYLAPGQMPAVEISRKAPGPSGLEYAVRFPSPSPFAGDVAYARVYEPEGGSRSLRTLIYGSGLAMAYDQLRYWPEEEYLGRLMSAWGYRVVLPYSTWHGRRAVLGFYSGEPVIATAPVGHFQFLSAQVQETASWFIGHARGAPRSSPSVASAWADWWPSRWPDAAAPGLRALGRTSSSWRPPATSSIASFLEGRCIRRSASTKQCGPPAELRRSCGRCGRSSIPRPSQASTPPRFLPLWAVGTLSCRISSLAISSDSGDCRPRTSCPGRRVTSPFSCACCATRTGKG